jgi:hypothetical protein
VDFLWPRVFPLVDPGWREFFLEIFVGGEPAARTERLLPVCVVDSLRADNFPFLVPE